MEAEKIVCERERQENKKNRQTSRINALGWNGEEKIDNDKNGSEAIKC